MLIPLLLMVQVEVVGLRLQEHLEVEPQGDLVGMVFSTLSLVSQLTMLVAAVVVLMMEILEDLVVLEVVELVLPTQLELSMLS